MKRVTKSNVSVKISGAGCRVTAYVINKKILNELRAAAEDDALYESNPYSMVGNIALQAIRVAQGFCIYTIDDLMLEVSINGSILEIDQVGFLDDGCEFEEEFTSERDKTLLARYENVEYLGEGVALKKPEIFIVEVEDIKSAVMNCAFAADGNLNLGELELGLVELDVDTDLSNATYLTGLLNGMEKDIRYVLCGGQKYEFDVNVLNRYPSSFYLVSKGADGKWSSNYLG
jgi:hypothetical protein